MYYIETKILKKNDIYEWSFKGPMDLPLPCLDRERVTFVIGDAWESIKKRILKIPLNLIDECFFCILYKDVTFYEISKKDIYEHEFYYIIFNNDDKAYKILVDDPDFFIDENFITDFFSLGNHTDIVKYSRRYEWHKHAEKLKENTDNDNEKCIYDIHSYHPEDYDQEGREDFFNVNKSYCHNEIDAKLRRDRELFLIREKQGEDNSSNRQKDILEWLEQSKYVKKIVKDNAEIGFYISRGNILSLKSGKKIDIIDWLLREGFKSLEVILYYNVSYTPIESEYSEKFSFFDIQLNV